MRKSRCLTGCIAILAAFFIGCGGAPETVGPAGMEGRQALAKQAVGLPTLVTVQVTQANTPMSNVQVALSRSISGRAPDYQWESTTGADGRAMFDLPAGASGYYLARATSPSSGAVLGRWGSIPINGGRATEVHLPIGGRATTEAGPLPETAFTVRIENVSTAYAFAASGIFATPVGASGPGPLLPGGAYEFSFDAPPGSRLSFATMFVHSNDFFYAPSEAGIALWDAGGNQVSGDITAQMMLWDSGTEINQEPGTGADQAPRQAGPNTGAADPNANVRLAPDTFNNLPPVSDVIRVTVTPTSATGFRVRIENISESSSLPSPLAPGVYVVHTDPAPLFTGGEPDRGEGLEGIAEDGNPLALAEAVAGKTGITVPLAPGAWAVHRQSGILFQTGQPDRGHGLEALAEDGNPAGLGASLAGTAHLTSSGVFTTPVGASGPGPLLPGNAYEFTIRAHRGDRLSFATMFVPSNDFFYAPDPAGLPLWDAGGSPIQGDITAQLRLWDAGTETDQRPGVGPDQAPFQSGPNTGAADPNTSVRLAQDTFNNLPPASGVLRVTITPQQ